MEKVKRYIAGLFVCVIVGSLLVIAGLSGPTLYHGTSAITIAISLCALGAIVLLFSVIALLELVRGEIFIKEKTMIRMNGGIFNFQEPKVQYEIWLFCAVPFARYNGFISITDGNGKTRVVKVPRRVILLGLARSDYRPVMWRSSANGLGLDNQALVTFRLEPSYKKTAFDAHFKTHECEAVTFVIKAVGKK